MLLGQLWACLQETHAPHGATGTPQGKLGPLFMTFHNRVQMSKHSHKAMGPESERKERKHHRETGVC